MGGVYEARRLNVSDRVTRNEHDCKKQEGSAAVAADPRICPPQFALRRIQESRWILKRKSGSALGTAG